MGRRDEDFVRSLLEGRTVSEAAREVGLSEERARSFLESIARFAGSVGTPADFALPGTSGTPRDADRSLSAGGNPEGDARRDSSGHLHELVVYTDGASNGNPGPSGAGGVIMAADGTTVEEFHVHLGRQTNNVAEYEAVRIALSRAIALGARTVTVRLDSELVANQLSGRFKVRDVKLIEQYLKVGQLLSQLDCVTFEAIPREENARADMLAQAGAKTGAR